MTNFCMWSINAFFFSFVLCSFLFFFSEFVAEFVFVEFSELFS